ncbi:TRAP transporter small permease [Ruegeria atlantica]|uniref:TRAP transporter small permease n=1 Tax=Ruegeria atlantica TaxID=81569 RepID=UPI0024958958|nr:TRAP transporter small permease [Ruegeria atlantica]
MDNLQYTLKRLSDFLTGILAVCAAIGIFALMALVFVSVFFRYVLNQPIIGTEDLMSLMLGMTIFTAFPTVTLSRGHIAVDLLTGPFKKVPTIDRIRLIAIDVGVITMIGFMAMRLWDQAVRYLKRGTTSNALDLPLYPFVYAFTTLLLLTAVLFALRAIRDLGGKSGTGEMSL